MTLKYKIAWYWAVVWIKIFFILACLGFLAQILLLGNGYFKESIDMAVFVGICFLGERYYRMTRWALFWNFHGKNRGLKINLEDEL